MSFDVMVKRRSLAVLAVVLALPSVADAQCPVPGFKYAAFGDKGIDASGGGKIQSYDSSSGVFTPTCAGGNVGTNSIDSATIKIGGGSDVCGIAEFGVGGSSSTVVVVNGSGSSIGGAASCSTSSCSALTSNLTMASVTVPALTLGSPASASGATINLASGYSYNTIDCSNTAGATLTLNAGTYVIDSLIVRNRCELEVASGPVSVFIKNTLDLGGSTTNPSFKATDLVFYGADTLTSVTINSAGTSVSFALYAPKAAITVTGNADMWGALVGATVKLTGGGMINYDKALGSLNSAAIPCANTEVSRAAPIIATLSGQTCVVQGTVENTGGTPTTILTKTDVANWVFPGIIGHMRARVASSISTAASNFSSGTIMFDAANGIPTVTTTGCNLGTNSSFSASCRNVFTNTNTTPANGTTFINKNPPAMVMFKDSNADTIGALIAPTTAVTGIGSTEWLTITRKVLRGTSAGTVSKLGGVDRSTVAVIQASTVAGSTTRPTMAYFGGTDGMLHAVCASTGGTTASQSNICPSLGTELWAFAPRVQLPLMRLNKQRVDGSVRVTDVFGDFSGVTTGTKSFRTILTFQTGYSDSTTRPAVYALDVTDPAKPILLWEYVKPSTATQFELGVGLAMAAGPSLVSGALSNLAVAQTTNGGTGANGFVVNALRIESGAQVWKFGYEYPSPPRGVTDDTMSPTGVPGGAVGVDLNGSGFTTDVVMGDLYGSLWRLDTASGTSATGSPTSPLFSFSTNRHPIGALPAILDNGSKVAVFGTGAYVDTDPSSTQWTTTSQSLIGVRLSSTTQISEGSSTLAINTALASGEKVSGQVLVVGTQVFVTTDTANINSSTYGTTSATTGNALSYNFASTSPTLVVMGALQSGASGLAVGSGTTLYAGGGDKQQQVSGVATAGGISVDHQKNAKASRLVWLVASK